MITIKFRGKRKDNGTWIDGDLVTTLTPQGSMTKCPAIYTTYGTRGTYFVYPESVGQFTGLYDDNGKEIYEGDIILQRGYYGIEPMVVKFELGAFIVGQHGGSSTKRRPMLIQNRREVIGNIIDNSELMKGNKIEQK